MQRSVSLDSLLQTPQALKIQKAAITIPRKRQWQLFTLSLVLLDVIMLGVGFRLAYFFRFDINLPVFQEDAIRSIQFYQTIVLFLIPFWILIFVVLGGYSRKNLLGGTREYSLIFNGTLIGVILLIALGFFVEAFVLARGWLILAFILTFLFVSIGRFWLRRGIYYLRQFGYYLSPAVIIGANTEGFSLAEQLLGWRSSGLHIFGFVDKKFPVGTLVFKDLYTLGSVDQLGHIVNKYNVEEIILASSAFTTRDSLLDIFKMYGVASGVNVRMSSGLYEVITTGLSVKEFANVPLVGINQVRLSGVDQLMKMVMDFSLTIPGLILISPLLLIIGIAIKLDSPGPIIHKRRVMGVNGREFYALKFRTMYINGEEILARYPELQDELGQNHKLKDDPRVTRIGKLLRKTSLDELTQLFNVLKGDMSLVGPRMITCDELNKYSQWDINLLTVRPGITGLWQVSGRSDVTYEQRVSYDMYYIRNWSIWLDIQLLLQTIPAVLRRRGAY